MQDVLKGDHKRIASGTNLKWELNSLTGGPKMIECLACGARIPAYQDFQGAGFDPYRHIKHLSVNPENVQNKSVGLDIFSSGS